jgi:dTDP-3-amino-3,4,6-trideoxy-alpha-D-glucose transaminase
VTIVPFLDLARRIAAHRDELEKAMGRVLGRGLLVLGAEVERFESFWAGYCGAAHCVGVGSGTDAIALALAGLGIGRGDEVVAPANTCIPTIVGIELSGAAPVLADVDAQTFTLDPGAFERCIGERTKAVVLVHLYGQCADVERVRAIASAHGVKVLEDAAQAHGSEFAGRRAGSLGDVAAFSFYPTKNLGALGDAGAVVTNDAAVAEYVRAARMFGERERNDAVLRGRNSRLDELQAAVLLVFLEHLDAATARRRAVADAYGEALRTTGLTLPLEAEGRQHVYHLYVVRTRRRDDLRRALADDGIETLIHYPRAVHQHPAYGDLARPGQLDVSEALSREVLSLPLYPELLDTEFAAVTDAVRRATGA